MVRKDKHGCMILEFVIWEGGRDDNFCIKNGHSLSKEIIVSHTRVSNFVGNNVFYKFFDMIEKKLRLVPSLYICVQFLFLRLDLKISSGSGP